MADMPGAIVLRLNERLEEAIDSSVVGIGWAGARGLDAIHDWETFKEAIRSAYPEMYRGAERSLGNAAGSAWRFIHGVSIGDFVVVPTGGGMRVGVISGPAYYDDEGAQRDFAWRRAVSWRSPDERPRTYAENALQRRLKARQTCVDAGDLVEQIEAVIRRDAPISFSDEVLRNVRAPIASALRQALNDLGLEHLVKRLAESSGARAQVVAKNNRLPGDVDVEALYDLKIGNQESIARVAYQVKQHDRVSDEEGIHQLLDRMEREQYDWACFVTTAASITDAARKLADENNIIVLTERELVDWIMMAGLAALRS